MIKECNKHGLVEHVLETRNNYLRCKKCRVEHVVNTRKKIKQKAIDYLGGCCIKCGYNKYPSVLEFHHRDPSQKDFQISSSLSWSKIVVELDKCDLLCANCHRELHYELDQE